MLSARQARTLDQFREELHCSKRTIQRDLRVLEKAGFPLVPEQRNGTTFWRFVEGFENNVPTPFTVPELMALVFSRGLLAPLAGTPIYEYLDGALRKIRARLSPASMNFLRQLENAVTVTEFGTKDYSASRAVLDTLADAIARRRTLEVEYRSETRRYDPYKLWFTNNALYVVGHDHLRGALRTYAVDRIRKVRPGGGRFEIPADFDFERLKKHAFPVMLREESVAVRIYFSPEQARYVAERQWHPTQQLKTQPDGSAVLSLEIGDLEEVKRWLTGFGSAAVVLEPAELRQTIRADAERLVAKLSRVGPARSAAVSRAATAGRKRKR